MATVLGLPTRFGGEITINRSDVNWIKTSEGSHSFGARLQHIWDRIKDWFCNTDLVDAKRQLSILYSPDASIVEKSDSYFKLMALVGDGYRDRFEVKPEAFGFSININFGDGIAPYTHSIVLCNREYLLAQLVEDVAKASTDTELALCDQRQLERDLPRAIFSIAREEIQGLLPVDSGGSNNLSLFQEAVASGLSPTKPQMLAIETLCYQKIFALVMLSSRVVNGGIITDDDISHIRGAGTSIFDLSKAGEDIHLHAHFTSEWQTEFLDRPSFLLTPCCDVKILISPTGEVSLRSAVYGADPI